MRKNTTNTPEWEQQVHEQLDDLLRHTTTGLSCNTSASAALLLARRRHRIRSLINRMDREDARTLVFDMLCKLSTTEELHVLRDAISAARRVRRARKAERRAARVPENVGQTQETPYG